ncbi:MAG: hypothetical protein OXR68_04515 [Alphaproteobacteria bacterium]|nr:hypothetical protein [Alphaproteobacteria bacterium]MDD9919871.1 hypothetical protein [Alphaproteobacteria bacterium]
MFTPNNFTYVGQATDNKPVYVAYVTSVPQSLPIGHSLQISIPTDAQLVDDGSTTEDDCVLRTEYVVLVERLSNVSLTTVVCSEITGTGDIAIAAVLGGNAPEINLEGSSLEFTKALAAIMAQ